MCVSYTAPAVYLFSSWTEMERGIYQSVSSSTQKQRSNQLPLSSELNQDSMGIQHELSKTALIPPSSIFLPLHTACCPSVKLLQSLSASVDFQALASFFYICFVFKDGDRCSFVSFQLISEKCGF